MSKKLTVIDELKTILLSGSAGTQDDIKHALEQKGFLLNQSKISRLLRKLGAIKITNEQQHIIYSLPREPAPPSTKQILASLVMNIATNETLIVIRTTPGSASLIGRVLDHHNQALNILGTVAGDDTIFIAPKSIKQIGKIMSEIRDLLDV